MYNKRLFIFAVIVCLLLIGDSVVRASKGKSQLKGYNKHSVSYGNGNGYSEKENHNNYHEMKSNAYHKENNNYENSDKGSYKNKNKNYKTAY